jgi:hypothetical protein
MTDANCMVKTDGYSFNGGSVAGQAAYESYHGTTLKGGGRRRSARRSAKRTARRSAKRAARRSAKRTNRRVSRRAARRVARRTAKRSNKRSAKLQGRRAVYREVEKSEGQQGGFFSSLFN